MPGFWDSCVDSASSRLQIIWELVLWEMGMMKENKKHLARRKSCNVKRVCNSIPSSYSSRIRVPKAAPLGRVWVLIEGPIMLPNRNQSGFVWQYYSSHLPV